MELPGNIDAQARLLNLSHSFVRGPGGSVSYTCKCGAEERYTSATAICPLATESAIRAFLQAQTQLTWKEETANCKGGAVIRFLLEEDFGWEPFLPLHDPADALLLWDWLTPERKAFVNWRATLLTGSPKERIKGAQLLALSQAAYQASKG